MKTLTTSQELVLFVILTAFFVLILKFFSNLKIKGKKIEISHSLIFVISGIFAGVIIRFAAGGILIFNIIPVVSLGTLATLLLSLGSMLDFNKIKKMGPMLIVISVVPMLVEQIVGAEIISLITGISFLSGLIISSLIAISATPVLSPKIIPLIVGKYESETLIAEISLLTGTLENFTFMPLFLVGLIGFEANSNPLINADIGTILLMVLEFLLLSTICGVVMAVVIIYILKPIAKLCIKTVWTNTDGMSAKQEKIAIDLDLQSRDKRISKLTGIFVLIFVFIFAFTMQTGSPLFFLPIIGEYTIPGIKGLGMAVVIGGVIGGMIISLLGSKSVENKKTQQSDTTSSRWFYMKIGAIFIIAFGAINADPTVWFATGSDAWSYSWDGFGMINLVWIIVFVASFLLIRAICVFPILLMFGNFTKSQFKYIMGAFSFPGTSAVNNGAVIPLVLGLGANNGVNDPEILKIQGILLGIGTFCFLVQLAVAEAAISYSKDRWIFSWGTKTSEIKFKRESKLFIKKEKLNRKQVKEIRTLSKTYWNDFFKLKKDVTKFEINKNKVAVKIENLIEFETGKLERIIIKNGYKILCIVQELDSLNKNKIKHEKQILKLETSKDKIEKNLKLAKDKKEKVIDNLKLKLNKEIEIVSAKKLSEETLNIKKDLNQTKLALVEKFKSLNSEKMISLAKNLE